MFSHFMVAIPRREGADHFRGDLPHLPAPAIVNAIYDAIGVSFNELPVTPEKILNALEEKKKTGAYGRGFISGSRKQRSVQSIINQFSEKVCKIPLVPLTRGWGDFLHRSNLLIEWNVW